MVLDAGRVHDDTPCLPVGVGCGFFFLEVVLCPCALVSGEPMVDVTRPLCHGVALSRQQTAATLDVEAGWRGGTHSMHSRGLKTIDPRVPTKPEQSTWGFH